MGGQIVPSFRNESTKVQFNHLSQSTTVYLKYLVKAAGAILNGAAANNTEDQGKIQDMRDY